MCHGACVVNPNITRRRRTGAAYHLCTYSNYMKCTNSHMDALPTRHNVCISRASMGMDAIITRQRGVKPPPLGPLRADVGRLVNPADGGWRVHKKSGHFEAAVPAASGSRSHLAPLTRGTWPSPRCPRSTLCNSPAACDAFVACIANAATNSRNSGASARHVGYRRCCYRLPKH